MSFPLFLGAVTAGLSLYEMWKSSKPALGSLRLLQDPDEEVDDVGVVHGAPAPPSAFTPVLGPTQGVQPGGLPQSPGRWVPTTPTPTSAEVNRNGGDGGVVWNTWGPGGWGWPYSGYPYGGYPRSQDMICQRSYADPQVFICRPQYRRRRAYAWAQPYWGW
jgi:hypothetical protein